MENALGLRQPFQYTQKKTPIIDTVNENQVSVAFGEIGLGKSTQMTQYFYEAGFAKNGLIVCTQPKKSCCH